MGSVLNGKPRQRIGLHIVIIISVSISRHQKQRGECCHELVEMKKTKTASQEELLDMLRERERMIKRLQTELNLMKNKSRTIKKTL